MRQLSCPEAFLLLVAIYMAFSNELLGLFARILLVTYAGLTVISFVVPPWSSRPAPITPAPSSYILLSGCTNGLGLEMTYLFADRGWNIVLLSRDESKLQVLQSKLQAKHPKQAFEILVQDLAIHDAAVAVVHKLKEMKFDVDEVENASSGSNQQPPRKCIDILLNNAGFGSVESFLTAPLSRLNGMISLHVSSTTSLCHMLLPSMLRRRRGRVVNVASMIGFLPSPRAAVYGATKAYLNSFTKSISYEVAIQIDSMKRQAGKVEPNLAVVLVCPGATRTNFAASAEAEDAIVFHIPFIAEETAGISKEIVEGIIEGAAIVQPGLLTSWIAWLAPKFPTKLAHLICFVLWGSGQMKKDFLMETNATNNSSEKKQH